MIGPDEVVGTEQDGLVIGTRRALEERIAAEGRAEEKHRLGGRCHAQFIAAIRIQKLAPQGGETAQILVPRHEQAVNARTRKEVGDGTVVAEVAGVRREGGGRVIHIVQGIEQNVGRGAGRGARVDAAIRTEVLDAIVAVAPGEVVRLGVLVRRQKTSRGPAMADQAADMAGVVVVCHAVVRRDFHAGDISAGDEIHDPRDGVRAVDGRRPVSDNLQTLDREVRDEGVVGIGFVRGRSGQPVAVHQRKRRVGRQPAHAGRE